MKLLRTGRLAVVALVALGVSPLALAQGTDADVTVTNSVTISYDVNSIGQTGSASVDFEVDRKYVVDVTTSDTNWVTATPGQSFAGGNFSSIRFTVSNLTNDSVGIRLALIDQADTAISGGDPWDAPTAELATTSFTLWEDSNGNGAYDAGTDDVVGTALGIQPVLAAPLFAEDESRDYYVTIDVAGGTAPDLFETYTLVAAITEATGTTVVQTDDSGNSTPGVGDPGIATNNLNGVDNVFAETASGDAEDLGYDYVGDAVSITDEDFDAQASDTSGFRTRVALGIAKFVEVLWDPVTGNKYDGAGALTGNNPKAIPGAVMLYVIGVRADSGVNATTVLIDDDIPETLITPGTAQGGIELPNSVDIDINGSTVTFTLDAAIAPDAQYHTVACGTGTLTSSAFDPGPEIDDANLGDCDGTPTAETGYVAYVATVDDT